MSKDVYLIQYEDIGLSTKQYWMIARSPEQAGQFITTLLEHGHTIKLVRRISTLPEIKKEEK